MEALIIIGYHKRDSFCHNGIKLALASELEEHNIKYEIIDLYEDKFHAAYKAEENRYLLHSYRNKIRKSTHIFFISPVWWFRCTSMLEGFFDQVFIPGFAYNFVPITKTYGIPKPLLSDKHVYTYLTHGAPALPVQTIYLNSVKWRLQLGVFSFIFGWFNTTIRQFFSVPFCSDSKRQQYLKRVRKDVAKEVKRYILKNKKRGKTIHNNRIF